MSGGHFAGPDAADRYAAGRPDYGPHLAEVLRRLLPPHHILDLAVDVGCGTGISTAPLLAVARHTVGVDPSVPMLVHATPGPRTTYVAGTAERLPLVNACAHLIAVGSAFHWLDRERFIREAARVTRPGAWLVVHDHWFPGIVEDRPGFTDWVRDVYLERYPSPPRNPRLVPGENLAPFTHRASEDYTHTVEMTRRELITYLVSQSNVGAVVDRGDEILERVVGWLEDELAAFLPGATAGMVVFGGRVSVLR